MASPSLRGVPLGTVPPLPRYYETLRIPSDPPAALRFLRAAGTTAARLRSRACRAPITRGPGFSVRLPQPALVVESYGPPRFLGNLRVRALFFDPGGSFAPGLLLFGALLLPPPMSTASAPSHCKLSRLYRTALHTRCLRFAARVTPAPRKTRFPGGGQPFPGGLFPARFPREVSAFVYIASSSPRLCLAH
jgi:hypothetical protein